jgi:hypothetical protein
MAGESKLMVMYKNPNIVTTIKVRRMAGLSSGKNV